MRVSTSICPAFKPYIADAASTCAEIPSGPGQRARPLLPDLRPRHGT